VSFAVIADGAPGAGLGHLARCSAIAVALRVRGVPVDAHAYGAEAPATVDGVRWEPYAGAPHADVVVLDTYTMPAAERAALAARGPMAFLHDVGEIPAGTALVIGGHGPLAGLRHAALRPAYWGLPERRVRERVARVVVTTGGGALRDVGVGLAREVRAVLPDAAVRLVRAPHATFEPPPGVELIDGPASLLEEFLAADVVVTAAGQTALEAAATGAATVALPLVDNQRGNADALAAAGAAVVVVGPETLGEALASLDLARRQTLARAAQGAVDGYGALRIAFRVAALAQIS
jgi:spore coat polysaccharide biosynthesis predicted glycosyltransferase SpsG